ncbi:MAG TPA: hypothetical protein VIW67_10445 [Terriglobales bacterium]
MGGGLFVILLLWGIPLLIEHVLGWIDLWWMKKFGKPLSGRIFGSGLQTLFPPRPPRYNFHLRSAKDNWGE